MARQRGARNKAVIERERIAAEIAARTVADARTSGKKLAKEILEEFMFLFTNVAAGHQPASPQDVPSDVFKEYATLAVDTARKLAPFQSPTFQAITIAPPPDTNAAQQRRRFTLTIFDGPPPPQMQQDEERPMKVVNPR